MPSIRPCFLKKLIPIATDGGNLCVCSIGLRDKDKKNDVSFIYLFCFLNFVEK